jgi:hypothetical protein
MFYSESDSFDQTLKESLNPPTSGTYSLAPL